MTILCDPRLPYQLVSLHFDLIDQSLLLGSPDRPYAHFPFSRSQAEKKEYINVRLGSVNPFFPASITSRFRR